MIIDTVNCYIMPPGQQDIDAALVNNADTSAPIEWASEVYDFNGYHSIVSNASRLIAPATGIYRVTGQVEHNNALQAVQIDFSTAGKGGPLFRGAGSGERGGSITSPPVALTAADYATITGSGGAGTPGNCWFGIERLDDALKYALVHRTGNLALNSGATVTVDFDAETADAGGWHDNSTANTRLTVPSGVTRIRVIGSSGTINVGSDAMRGFFSKNGADFTGRPICTSILSGVGASCGINVVSPVLIVSAGDYFEFTIQNLGTTNGTLAAGRLFAGIEEIPAWERCCLVKRTSDQSCTLASDNTITWQAAEYDDDGIWDGGAPTRLTAPTGASYARLSYGAHGSPTPMAAIRGRVLKNGSFVNGLPDCNHGSASGATDQCASNGIGFWTPCAPGDYFELVINPSATFNFGSNTGNWFCAEFR